MAVRYMYRIKTKLKTGLLDMNGNIEYKDVTIFLDAIDDTTVDAESTITTHPTFDGQSVADHMYRNPVTISISGSFPTNATVQAGGSLIDYTSYENVPMSYMQHLFEQIKDEGAICSLAKLVKDGSYSAVRFKTRPKTVLQSISWTEKTNTLSYTFKFTEIMTAVVQDYSKDTGDPFLPGIDVLQSISFTQEVMNWTAVGAIIFTASIDSGWMSQEFANYLLSEQGKAMYVTAVGGIFTGVGGIGIIYAIAAGSVPGPGWVIAALIGLGVAGYGIYKAIKGSIDVKKYARKQLTLAKTDEENRKNVEIYTNFESEIYKQLRSFDNVVSAYSMTLDKECQFYISFENNYYLCKVEKNLTKLKFIFCDVEGHKLGRQISDISEVPLDLFECSPQSYIHRLPYTGSYVYLINKPEISTVSSSSAEHSFSGGGQDIDTKKSSYQSSYISDILRRRTNNFYLVASQLSPVQFENTIKNIVLNAIMRQ